MSIFVKREKIFNCAYPSTVRVKRRAEYEAAIDDALRETFESLIRATNRFNSVINDKSLQNDFAEAVDQAQEVVLRMGLKKDDWIESE